MSQTRILVVYVFHYLWKVIQWSWNQNGFSHEDAPRDQNVKRLEAHTTVQFSYSAPQIEELKP